MARAPGGRSSRSRRGAADQRWSPGISGTRGQTPAPGPATIRALVVVGIAKEQRTRDGHHGYHYQAPEDKPPHQALQHQQHPSLAIPVRLWGGSNLFSCNADPDTSESPTHKQYILRNLSPHFYHFWKLPVPYRTCFYIPNFHCTLQFKFLKRQKFSWLFIKWLQPELELKSRKKVQNSSNALKTVYYLVNFSNKKRCSRFEIISLGYGPKFVITWFWFQTKLKTFISNFFYI